MTGVLPRSQAVAPALDAMEAGAEPRLAAAPFYDLPELRSAHDALWAAIRERVLRAGVEAPPELTRGHAVPAQHLLLGQVGGYRYMTELTEKVGLAATPRYRAPGADGPFLRGAVLVRRDDPATGLAELRGRSLALETDDLDSANLLRAEVAPLVQTGRFFGALAPTASFAASAEAVADGDADAAVIDAVAYAHLRRLRPTTARELRVLLWTARSPGAPFVTAKTTPPAVIEALVGALQEIERDPGLRSLRAELLLDGFNPLPKAQYRAALHLAQIAESQGYSELG